MLWETASVVAGLRENKDKQFIHDQKLSHLSSFLRVVPIPSRNLSGQLLKLEDMGVHMEEVDF